MRNDYLVVALCALTVLLWGLWGFFGKLALGREMPPLSIFLAEVSIGFLIGLGVMAFVLVGGGQWPWQKPMSFYGVLSGGTMAAGLLVYYLVLQKGRASIVVPLTATYPAVTVVLSLLFLGDRLTFTQVIGVLLVVVGIVLLLLVPGKQ